jgi:sec-independent protein translocase protein TatA
MIDISPIQILMVLAIALIVLGPSKLPAMARAAGRGIREFRGAVSSSNDAGGARARRPPAPAEEREEGDLDGVIVSGARGPGPPG